jgi:hypothetical protein
MWAFAILVLLVSSVRVSAVHPSSFPSKHSGASSLSSPPTHLSTSSSHSLPSSVTLTSNPAGLSSSGSSSSPPPSSAATTSISVLTQSGPSIIPVTPYPFSPFPSPSSEPPIPGVYPASSPKQPPPVESPALVPNFAQAWTTAYDKAKAKVGILNPLRKKLVSRVLRSLARTCGR